ncbi:MAG: phosphatase PAP2 family protein [Vicingus serpentipes]|nr:phosphatase PAP2 family protein [Vicingus serpentipes]
MLKRIIFILLIIGCYGTSLAIKRDSLKIYNRNAPQEFEIRGATYSYNRPKPFTFYKNIPKDLVGLGKSTWKKESILPISTMLAATAITFYYDEELINESQISARRIGLNNENDFVNVSRMSIFKGEDNLPLPLPLPEDFPTAMYFLGDGITSLFLSAGFYSFGLLTKDNRALTTSNEITGVLISMGIVTQSIKRITGRTSPVVSTSPRGGHWKFLPSFAKYNKNTSQYDAMPSGHMATAMATLTVIADNYNEYRFIRPVGYTLMGLMGYQMAQTKVHWVSDYPLAILLGYVMGKNAVKRGRTEIKKEANSINQQPNPFWKKIQINPLLYDNTKGISLSYQF